ncbi:MAG: DeoR/GlpR family DNA-binding transcription regulator [Peptoniphilaceae bacterium]|nr:DeoR/GlpR family DNA-binding transcription regulator [Peptoniphilaceae bacterium]MDY3076455.1 DeoR/GlpR family DNA-binding transcription regulator [Peptoniphilaceae bacterium]
MIPEERFQKITELLKQKKAVTNKEIMSAVYASLSTIRRDLIDLEKAGVVRRIKGGAMLASSTTAEVSGLVRFQQSKAEKQSISAMAAEYLKDGQAIYLDSSSTTYYLCNWLSARKNMVVVTNSIRVPIALMNADSVRVFCAGGLLKHNSHSLIGSDTAQFLMKYRAEICFFSCMGLGSEGLFEADEQQVVIKSTMIRNAKRSILMVDHSKFCSEAFIKLADFSAVDLILTDRQPDNWEEFDAETQAKMRWPKTESDLNETERN